MTAPGGNSKIGQDAAYQLAGPLGLITGVSGFNKFGRARDVDTTDDPATIWPGSDGAPVVGNSLYTYSASAEAHYIASTDAGDTTQTVTVQGLDADWNVQTIEVSLNGQTRVRIGSTETFIRVFRASSDAALAGTVHVGVGTYTSGSPDSANDVRAVIVQGSDQTEQAAYSIPDGYSGLLTGYHLSLNRISGSTTAQVTVTLRVREFGETAFKVKATLNLRAADVDGSRLYDPHLVIPAKADIELRVDEVSANDVDITGEFDLWLVQDGAL